MTDLEKTLRRNHIAQCVDDFWMWVNAMDDGDEVDAKDACEFILSATIDGMMIDIETAVMRCPFLDLRYPLTKFEQNWARKRAEKVLAEAQEIAEAYEFNHPN